jgi:hypothetical protein
VSTRSLLRNWLLAALTLVAIGQPLYAQDSDGSAPGIAAEPQILSRGIAVAERRLNASNGPPSDGFFIDFGNMITGSGWLSAGPGYRLHVLDHRAVVTASAAVSWRLYTMAQVRIETASQGRAHAGAQAFYQDSLQVNYFGVGNDTPFSNRTGYRLRTTDVTGYGSWRSRALVATGRVGWLGYADLSPMAGRLPDDYPSIGSVFTEATAPGLSDQPQFVHADASLAADTRDQRADPSRGGSYRVSAARYADRSSGRFTFNLYELDAAQYVTVVQDKVVLAGHAWAALTSTAPGAEVPFYLMPNIGGKNTMRGYTDFRFFDRDMETFSLESRFRVYTHLDVALLLDTGKVAPRVSALGLSDMHSSVGVGFRLRSGNRTFARLDVARGSEGWHFVLTGSEPFHRKAMPSGTPVVPYVP